MSRPIAIAPSVLPADFSALGQACIDLEAAGVDRMHWDVMDGVFVPNLTMGPGIIKSCRPHVKIPFEAHLMVVNPELLMHTYVEAGCDILTLQAESTIHLHRALDQVRQLGASPAVAINPGTPISAIEHVLDLVDMVLVMTVNPGFGGQSYIATMEPKVAELRARLDERGLDADIEVDGGISADTIAAATSAGANVFVSGSALFRYPTFAEGVADLRAKAEAAQ